MVLRDARQGWHNRPERPNPGPGIQNPSWPNFWMSTASRQAPTNINTDELVYRNVAQTGVAGKEVDARPPYLP